MTDTCAITDYEDYGSIGVLWKTVSEDCNLACDYCYYSTCGGSPVHESTGLIPLS